MADDIDYDNLKKRGFLRQRQDGLFLFRIRMSSGVLKKEQLDKINQVASEFGQGFIHLTVRQGIEIPFIKFEDISKVEAQLKSAGVESGTSGACVRAITVCPGNNWCRLGLINTFAFSDKIEKKLGIACGLNLPSKFKIAISGCPNCCTRVQQSEIGIHGVAGGSYAIYLGGCGGRVPHTGFKLVKVFNENEVLLVIENTVNFFKTNGKPKQRLALLIEEIGKDKFLKDAGLEGI